MGEIDEHIDVGVQGDVGDGVLRGMDYDWMNEGLLECFIFAFFYVLKVLFQTKKS